MAEFKRLSEVEQIESTSENATVLVEDGGEIKRVPKTAVGGGGGAGGIATAIIKDSEYDNTIAGIQTMIAEAPQIGYECINMTFDEAYQIMANGEPLSVYFMMNQGSSPSNMYGIIGLGTAAFSVPCLSICNPFASLTLYWTVDGISTEEPSGGK